MNVLRRLERAGLVLSGAALTAWEDFRDLSVDAYAFDLLAVRAWELRHQFTAYDAAYVALAEELGAPLVAADAKLVSSGHHAELHVVTRRTDPQRS